MTVTIRRAGKHDLAALGHLGATLMRVHYTFDPQRFLPAGDDAAEGYAWFLGTRMKSEDDAVFVAEEDGAVVGYIWAALEPLSWKELRGPAGFVHDIVVREESRGAGIAERLMQTAVDWLRERGAPRVILWTAAPNGGAHRLFRRLGFRDTMVEMTMEL